MRLYRFSPIKNEDEFQRAIEYIHFESYKLCRASLGEYLPSSGNIAIFCHYQEEYEYLTEMREKLTTSSENYNQKYYKLHNPIVIPAKDDVPETRYDFLYIRRPDPYRHHVGDLDFCLSEDEYFGLKKEMENGSEIPGARLFPSPQLEMIELFDSDYDVLAYVHTAKMADLVKITKSEAG